MLIIIALCPPMHIQDPARTYWLLSLALALLLPLVLLQVKRLALRHLHQLALPTTLVSLHFKIDSVNWHVPTVPQYAIAGGRNEHACGVQVADWRLGSVNSWNVKTRATVLYPWPDVNVHPIRAPAAAPADAEEDDDMEADAGRSMMTCGLCSEMLGLVHITNLWHYH